MSRRENENEEEDRRTFITVVTYLEAPVIDLPTGTGKGLEGISIGETGEEMGFDQLMSATVLYNKQPKKILAFIQSPCCCIAPDIMDIMYISKVARG